MVEGDGEQERDGESVGSVHPPAPNTSAKIAKANITAPSVATTFAMIAPTKKPSSR